MAEDSVRRSFWSRLKEQTGWWLAAVGAVIGILAFLISMTWPNEWRDNANDVCMERVPRFATAMRDATASLEALAETGGSGIAPPDVDVRKAGRQYEEAGNLLSELVAKLSAVDRPWVGGLDGQIDTTMDHGSALARAYNNAGRAISDRDPVAARSHLADVAQEQKAWTSGLKGLKATWCAGEPD